MVAGVAMLSQPSSTSILWLIASELPPMHILANPIYNPVADPKVIINNHHIAQQRGWYRPFLLGLSCALLISSLCLLTLYALKYARTVMLLK